MGSLATQIPVALPLAVASVLDPDPWAQGLVVCLVGISVWTGIESAHARVNADLPTEEEWTRTE